MTLQKKYIRKCDAQNVEQSRNVGHNLFKSTLTYVLEGISYEKVKYEIEMRKISDKGVLESRGTDTCELQIIDENEAHTFRSIITQFYPKKEAFERGYHIIPITKTFEITKNEQVDSAYKILNKFLNGNYLVLENKNYILFF